MADETTAPRYVDEKDYSVKLMRPVTFRGAKFLPLHEHEMTGATLNAIVDQESADVVDRADAR